MSVSFDYTIKRHPKRKRLALLVTDNGVEVRAPLHVNERSLHQWVREQSLWVEKQLKTKELRQQQKPTIENGNTICFLGRDYTLHISQHNHNQVVEVSEQLHVHHTTKQNAHNVFSNWLKQEAKLYISERCQELALTLNLQQQVTGIGFRKTKSKWGHCTSAGKLQFNWLLIMAPVEVIDYVIIHELCHLTHMNHSKAFWELVGQYCPTYKLQKKWLNDNGHRITL